VTKRHLLSAIGLAAFLLFWEAIALSGWVAPALLPPPTSVPARFVSEISLGVWPAVVLASIHHYLIGLVAGSLAGVAMGAAVALFPRLDAAQSWLALLLRPIPPLAWVPFAIVWFGITEAAAAFIIAIGIFWINYFTAYAAVRGVDKDLIELATAFGHGSLWARLRKVILPGAAPGVFSGLRAGIGQGWMTVVAAELFGITGIGQRMMEAAGLLATSVVIVYMLTIAALYAASDALFMLVQRRLLQWQQ
jgi:ABC-type nitrate/sulfonate/bicarbonate transport system permease component